MNIFLQSVFRASDRFKGWESAIQAINISLLRTMISILRRQWLLRKANTSHGHGIYNVMRSRRSLVYPSLQSFALDWTWSAGQHVGEFNDLLFMLRLTWMGANLGKDSKSTKVCFGAGRVCCSGHEYRREKSMISVQNQGNEGLGIKWRVSTTTKQRPQSFPVLN